MSERDAATVGTEAIEHFLRMNEPGERARRAAEFQEWLTRSPAHVEAYLAVVTAWGAIDPPAEGRWSSDELIAAARFMPGVCGVLVSRLLPGITWTPSCFQSLCPSAMGVFPPGWAFSVVVTA